MRASRILGATLALASLLLSSTASEAATKRLTCYHQKTGATKIVRTTTCPKGYARFRPARLAYDDLQVSQAWFKAMDTAMPMDGQFMSAAFMMITNLSDRDVTLIGGAATLAGEVQIHEVVNGKMRMIAGGLRIKAGTTEQLQAGGNHLMFVFMPKRILAGDEVTFVLRFSDGRQLKVTTPVKATNAGSESYEPQSSM